MNERIKELAIKAGGEFWQRLENDVVNAEAYITFDPPESLDKFAELIVLECVRYFNEDYQRDFDTLWREDLSKGIKEHFGVE